MSSRAALGALLTTLLFTVSDATTGVMADLVPTAGDQEIEMNVNGDSLSGVAEEYVSVCMPHLIKPLPGPHAAACSFSMHGGWFYYNTQ